MLLASRVHAVHFNNKPLLRRTKLDQQDWGSNQSELILGYSHLGIQTSHLIFTFPDGLYSSVFSLHMWKTWENLEKCLQSSFLHLAKKIVNCLQWYFLEGELSLSYPFMIKGHITPIN